MITLPRRRILQMTTMIPLGLALANCSQAQAASWVAAVQSLGQEFAVIEPEFAALGVSPNVSVTVAGQQVGLNGQTISIAGQSTSLTQVGALVGNLTNALGAAAQVSDGQAVLIKIEAYVNAVVTSVWPVIGPLVTAASPPTGLTIGLIVAAIPAVEGLLNFSVDFYKTFLTSQAQQLAVTAPAPASGALRPSAGARPGVLTPQEALALLMERAGKGDAAQSYRATWR